MPLARNSRILLTGRRCIALLFFVFSGGCAQFGDGVGEAPRIAIAAERDALVDKPVDASDDPGDSPDTQESVDLSLVKVPLEGAVRRLVTSTLEAAALRSADSAGPRAAVVLPASSSGLQPPNLGVAAATIIAQLQAATDFPGLRFVGDEPRLLPQADWALSMNVHFSPDMPGRSIPAAEQSAVPDSHLCVRVLDLNDGKVLAAKQQILAVDSINRVPTRYFRDLPVVLPWQALFGPELPCASEAPDSQLFSTPIDLRARAAVEMHFSRASALYGQRDHAQAREEFRALAQAIDAAEIASSLDNAQQARLHARLGEYLATWRMVFNRGAAGLFLPLVEALFAYEQEVALNLSLSPVNVAIIADRRMKSRQTEWLIEISRLLRRNRWCADIFGFATDDFLPGKPGSGGLGLQHADYVRDQLRRHSKFSQTAIISRAADTKGEVAMALTGDVRDEWARRVSVKVVDCRSRRRG